MHWSSRMSKRKSMVKLDQDDYENIFLRVRERLLIHLFAAVSVFFAIIGASSWVSAKAKIDELTEVAVNNYIQSDEFRRNVILAYQEKLGRLEARSLDVSKMLAEQQYKIAQLSELPVLIDSNGLSLINKEGHMFRIEMGSAKSGEAVIFKAAYKSKPTVLLSVEGSALDAIAQHRLQSKGAPVLAVNATLRGFEIPPSVYSFTYNWVAFGQQEGVSVPARP